MRMIQTILYPTDFSEPAQDPFGFACLLAKTLKARLLIVHVCPPPICHGEVTARRQENGYHDLLWKDLEKIQPPDSAVRVEHLLEEGEAADTIVRVARDIPCDLIVMGTHGRTGLGRLLLGSVAEKVLRDAPCPVLTMRSPGPEAKDRLPESGKVETILFPTDFSECSQNALNLAFALTRDFKARLLVLHVATPPPFVTYGEFEKVLDKSSGYRHELEEQLRQCQSPECNKEFRLVEGDPGNEIVQVAREAHCDLIIMGTHGRTGLGRVLMGSVAEKVLRQTPCPVLMVKNPVPGKETSPSATAPEPAKR